MDQRRKRLPLLFARGVDGRRSVHKPLLVLLLGLLVNAKHVSLVATVRLDCNQWMG